jgi:putative ABC transport system substrate-binding protein
MRRRDFVAGLGGTAVSAAACPPALRAQQPALPAVGVLYNSAPDASPPTLAAFLKGLGEAGYFDGKNVSVEYRWAEGRYERLPDLAAGFVRRQVALIATGGIPATLAAKAATTSIPIVFSIGGDPVELGLVASLNRPGGNLTGTAQLAVEVTAKRFALLHELVPSAASIALLANPANRVTEATIRQAQVAARALGVSLSVLSAGSESEIEQAFGAAHAQRAGALVVNGDPFLNSRRDQIVALAARNALPVIYYDRAFVEAGGLLSYGSNLFDDYRQAGAYAARILKGAKPADLPVVQPTKFEMVLNLKTAKALALDVPTSILLGADEVIE